MISEKNYYFTIVVHPDGNQMPYINYSLKENEFLKQLVYLKNLQKSSGVIFVLDRISKVLNEEIEKEELWETEYEVPCFLKIDKIESIIGDAYSQSDELSFKILTYELKKMFEKWLEFLVKYENNEIPNLRYDFK